MIVQITAQGCKQFKGVQRFLNLLNEIEWKRKKIINGGKMAHPGKRIKLNRK